MYQKQQRGWLKHFDFMVIDMLAVQLAFIVAYMLREGGANPYRVTFYREMGILLGVFSLLTPLMLTGYRGILRRGRLSELRKVVENATFVVLWLLLFFFLMKQSEMFSRSVLILLWILDIVLSYTLRSLHKITLHRHMEKSSVQRSIVVLTERETLEDALYQLETNIKVFRIVGIAFDEAPKEHRDKHGLPVVSGDDEVVEFLTKNVVDEIFVYWPSHRHFPKSLVRRCAAAGITVHLHLATKKDLPGNHELGTLGECMVLTSAIHMITPLDAVVKRAMDICGALVGLLIAGLIALFVGPFIYIASPGPIVFSQTRIGRNGRPFRFYKFRSMYMDAEARQAELEAQNKMQGLMFKIDNDPRIIKGVGHFIRKTSLDEFPQFWNVLRGDMSLVGTRPPTQQEYNRYELQHKSRLAFKPGITGLWQVSGRSNIVDFDEVVSLDTQYISNWSVKQDIRILLQTVLSVVGQKGSE